MSRSPRFDRASPDYSGVLASSRSLRLIVSARGAAYILQARSGFVWSDLQSFPCADALRSYFGVVAIDPPAALSSVVIGLPDDPRDCAAVPYALPPAGNALH